MNNIIVKNWNNIITPEDDVYILGDLMLGGANKITDGMSYILSLQGKLHIVRGNHDTDKRWELYKTLPNVVELENSIYLKYDKYHFYLSHYPSITSNNDYDKPLRARLLNLCGHIHTQDKWCDFDKGYIYHCELDAHGCKPVSIDTIIKDFKDMYKNNKNIDRQIEIDKEKISYDRTLFKLSACDRCVYQYNTCPGPNMFQYPPKCPHGFTFKRDPPDGGYYG